MTEPCALPPIPSLVFTVAITGHQDIARADHAGLKAQITSLLEQTRAQLHHGMADSEMDQARALTCRFVSALAPGADQIGANAALETVASDSTPKWHLYAVLPFSQSICATLAAGALRKREVPQEDIDTALAAMEKLAGDAHRVLELADWQPGDEAHLAQNWQSRRYATIGQMLVRQADLLIALWDGKPARGSGGTADVVSEARRSGVPVVWIDTRKVGPARSLVPDAGSRHLPASDIVVRYGNGDSRVKGLISDGPDAAISAAISQVLPGGDPARAICIQRYLDETPVQRWIATPPTGEKADDPQSGSTHRAYAWMVYWFLNFPPKATRKPSPQDISENKKPPALRSYPFKPVAGRWRRVLLYSFDFGVKADQPGTANTAPLHVHAQRADALASGLSDQYRSAYVKIFALAPVAVMWAVLSVLLYLKCLDLKPWMVMLELLTVAWAASIYRRTRAHDPVTEGTAKRHGWRRLFPLPQDTHQRWLDARLIAESQRSGQLLAWVGLSGRRPIEPITPHDDPHHHADGHAAPRTVWAPHYANAIAALPDLPLDEAAASKRAIINPQRVAQLAEAAGKVITDQFGYHDLNHQRLEKLNHRLDTLSLWAIIAAFITSAAYLVLWIAKGSAPLDLWPATIDKHSLLYSAHDIFKYAAAFFGAVLPAVAAAAAGIRFQGDFERFAMRSKNTATQLKALAERADNLKARADACGNAACSGQSPLLEPLLGLLLDTQDVLDEDLADWRFAYAARPITLG